jgi:hypothetical protein
MLLYIVYDVRISLSLFVLVSLFSFVAEERVFCNLCKGDELESLPGYYVFYRVKCCRK